MQWKKWILLVFCDWGRTLVCSLGIYVALCLLWLVFKWGGEEYHTLLSDIASLPIYPVIIILALRTARHAALDQKIRLAYFGLALAYLLYGLGDLVWYYLEVVMQITPFPSLADFFYLAFYPAMLWSLLAFHKNSQTRAERIQFSLDSLIVVLGGGMVVWYFILHPLVETRQPDVLSAILTLAYPVGDLLLLFGITSILLRRQSARNRKALLFLVLSMGLFFVADLSYSYLTLQKEYQSGDWPDALWILAAFAMGIGSRYQYTHAVRNDSEAKTDEADVPPFSYLPYIALAVGYGLLLFIANNEWGARINGLLLGAVILSSLVVTRQIIAVRENTRLLVEKATLTEELQHSEERFRAMVQNSADMIAVLNAGGNFLYQSPSLANNLGFPAEFISNQNALDFLHPDDLPIAQRLLEGLLQKPDANLTCEFRVRRNDGRWMTIEVIGQNMLDNPAVGGIVVNSRDISERKLLEEQLTHQAYHDPLTGLANRALFIKQIEAGLTRLDQTRRMCAILFLDLDNFKSINDTLGHQSGDQLLTSVTQRLQTCTQQNDMAARIGGDEFAILLPDIAAESDAIAVANRIIAGLQKPFQVGDHEISTSTSIGIAFGSSSRLSAGDLLRQADMAMYNAKTGGKSRYSVFDEALVYSLK